MSLPLQRLREFPTFLVVTVLMLSMLQIEIANKCWHEKSHFVLFFVCSVDFYTKAKDSSLEEKAKVKAPSIKEHFQWNFKLCPADGRVDECKLTEVVRSIRLYWP